MMKNLLFTKSAFRITSAALQVPTAILLIMLLTMFSSVTYARIWYVKAGAGGGGSSWGDASGVLGAMIKASTEGDQIWVAGGAYQTRNRVDSFRLKSGVSIYGGFEGYEKEFWERNLNHTVNKSTLLGNDYPAIYNTNIHDALLDGFTITGEQSLTAIINVASSVTIANCIIAGNKSASGVGRLGTGGGISSTMDSNLWLINCVISGHAASNSPVLSNAGYAALYNCTISGNFVENASDGHLHGIIQNESRLDIRNNIIYGNSGPNVVDVQTYAKTNIQNSLIQGMTGTENGNLSGDLNPLFVTPLVPSETPSTGGDAAVQPCP